MKKVIFGPALFLFISLLIQHCSITAMTPSQRQIIQSNNVSQPAITCSMYTLGLPQGQNILIRPAALEPTPLKKASYFCESCPKSFLWHSDLIAHNRTHTGEKPFTCDLCPKKFAQPSNLNTHKKRIHFGEKPHSCKECEQTFFQKKDLIVHTMIHTGEKPFTCIECNENFKRNEHLKIHSRIHNKDKPYACDLCPKSFSQSNNLATHKRTHTKEKLFACTLCNKGYDDQSNYNRHMKSKTHEAKYLKNEDPETMGWHQDLIQKSSVKDINDETMFIATENTEAFFPTIDNEPFNNPFPAINFFQLDL